MKEQAISSGSQSQTGTGNESIIKVELLLYTPSTFAILARAGNCWSHFLHCSKSSSCSSSSAIEMRTCGRAVSPVLRIVFTKFGVYRSTGCSLLDPGPVESMSIADSVSIGSWFDSLPSPVGISVTCSGLLRQHISTLPALASIVLRIWTGVLRHSKFLMLRLLSGFSCRSRFRISQCSIAAVKLDLSRQSSKTAMRVLVNECRPGWGAHVSKPQAAIVSVTLLHWPSAGALLAAAQQSSSKSTSASACSNMVCMAYHCRYGELGSPVLLKVSLYKYRRKELYQVQRGCRELFIPPCPA